MMRSHGSILALTALLLSVFLQPVSADPGSAIDDIRTLLPELNESQIAELLAEGELTRMIDTDEGPLLVPGEDFKTAVAEDLESVGYTIGVEVLNLIPEGYDDFDMVSAANNLLELSTLKGLEYYSASREHMRTLFVQSYAIDSAENANPVPDPSISGIPSAGSAFMFQEDMTFGKNTLAISYRVTQSTIHMITENITTFSWGPIPLIRPGMLRLHVLLNKTDNCILYYGNFGAKAIKINILKKRIYNSFYNRLVALYGWFENKLVIDPNLAAETLTR